MTAPIFLASPFAAATPEGYERHRAYARACMRDSSIARGESPLAPHLLWSQILDDRVHDEREHAMRLGEAWLALAHKLVLYTNLGKTSGMALEEAFAHRAGIKVEYRQLGGEWSNQQP